MCDHADPNAHGPSSLRSSKRWWCGGSSRIHWRPICHSTRTHTASAHRLRTGPSSTVVMMRPPSETLLFSQQHHTESAGPRLPSTSSTSVESILRGHPLGPQNRQHKGRRVHRLWQVCTMAIGMLMMLEHAAPAHGIRCLHATAARGEAVCHGDEHGMWYSDLVTVSNPPPSPTLPPSPESLLHHIQWRVLVAAVPGCIGQLPYNLVVILF